MTKDKQDEATKAEVWQRRYLDALTRLQEAEDTLETIAELLSVTNQPLPWNVREAAGIAARWRKRD